MRNKLHIIILLLLVSILAAPVVYGTATIQLSKDTIENNPEIIKANYYMNSKVFEEYVDCSYVAPYRAYLEEMESDTGFDAGFAAWTMSNFVENIGDVLEGDILSEKGFYESILFEMFYAPERNDSFVQELNAKVKKSNISTAKVLVNAYESLEYGAYPSKNEILSDDELYRLRLAAYEQGGSYYGDIFGTYEIFNKALSSAKTIDEISHRINTLIAFKEEADSRLNILTKMYEQADEQQLKNALGDMLDYYEKDFSISYIVGKELYDLAIDKIIKKASSYVWSDVVNNLGGGWAKLTYTVGKAALNSWLSTDQYYECFYQMNSLRNVESLMQTVSRDVRNEFKNNPTEETAAMLNSCVSTNMNMYNLAFEYSENYLSMLDDMGINHVAQALGYAGIDHSDMIEDFQQEKRDMAYHYNLAESMIDEIGHQGQEGYEDGYSESYILEGQDEFDAYCEISADISDIMPNCKTKMKISGDDLVANKSCRIGPANIHSLTVDDSSIILNDDTTIRTLALDNGQLEAEGDLTLYAVSKMESEDDLLHVKGDFTVGNVEMPRNYYTSTMTAGTVKLEGDLNFRELNASYVLWDTPSYGYYPTETCKTVFCGNDLQTVTGGTSSDSKNLTLGNVEILTSNFLMKDNENLDMTLLADADIKNEGDINVRELNLNGHKLKTEGKVDATTVQNTSEAPKEESQLIAGKGVNTSAIKVTSGKMKIGDDVTARTLTLDNAQLEAEGDLTLYAVSKMESEDDLLHVKGDFTVGGSSSYGSNMAAGTVELCGNLKFNGSKGCTFTRTCKAVFCGLDTQAVQGSSSEIKCLKNVINAHKTENDLTSSYDFSAIYIWDPEYKTGDRYLQLSTVSDSNDSYEYTGNQISPNMIVNYGDIELEKGTDYTISCTNNVNTGSANIDITGTNNYKGTISSTFNIVPASILNTSIKEISDQVFTGKEIVPDASIEYKGKLLEKDIDYNATYYDNKAVGTGNIDIEGIGNFTGNTSIQFNIIPNDLLTEEELKVIQVKKIEGVPPILEEYYDDASSIIQALPKTIQCILNSGREVTLNITWNCDNYDLEPSSANVFTWKIIDSSYKFDEGVLSTGELIIVNKAASSIEIGATDKTVAYCDSVDISDLFAIDKNAGKAAYSIISGGTGKGSLDGTRLIVDKPGTFIIQVTTSKNGKFAAGEAQATLCVLLPKIISVNAPDVPSTILDKYYTSWNTIIETLPQTTEVNTEKGIAEMPINWYCESYNNAPGAKNTFKWVIDPIVSNEFDTENVVTTGTVVLTNKSAIALKSDNVTLSATSFSYDGNIKTPTVTVKDSNGAILIEGIDYVISYSLGRQNSGNYKITVTGKGNYIGTVTKSFSIEAKPIVGASVYGIVNKAYTGKAITQSVTVRDGSKALKAGTDYAVSYKNNINVGTAAAIITGKGNYTGTITKTFAISKANQTIGGAKTITKAYGAKVFSLGATAKGKLTYKSGNKKVVTVSSKGKVTIKGTGRTTITITAAATGSYNKAVKAVTITVTPKKAASLKVKAAKKKMTVSWKKDSKASGYQITYAQNKKFTKSKKAVTISNYKTVKKTVSKLKSKKTYYVKVRAYKKVGGTKIYGSYSSVKKVKIK